MNDGKEPKQATDIYTVNTAISAFEATRSMPDIVQRLWYEKDVLQTAMAKVLTGGNHLATHIDPKGPGWQHNHNDALKHYGAGPAYDAWCCWQAIRQAQAMVQDAGV